jgi:hypothetical protein
MKTGFFREWHLYLLLFLLSFGIYFFYYHHLLQHLNEVLFVAEGDSIKNYYTYAYHVSNDQSLLHFSGMNYPFGEHVVYTDCQPLLSGILQLLPFTHSYAIGILHGLMLLSFIVTPLILLRIFTRLGVNLAAGFFSSLAIAVLSPQMYRIGGHFALAYGCVIPLAVLFLLNYFRNTGSKNLLVLFSYSLCLFFIHPYFGLGVSAFSCLSMLLREWLSTDRSLLRKRILMAISVGIGPILFFKLFMIFTDTHQNRPTEPYGVDIMGAAANLESVFTPSFGPFIFFLKGFIKVEHVEWEALSYIGIFPFLMLVIGVLALPFYFRKMGIQKELLAIFITSVLILLFSFGLHMRVLELLHLKIAALNQFRAFGRFAWYFYFMLPVFAITLLSRLCSRLKRPKVGAGILVVTSLLLFFFNMLEGHYLLTALTTRTFEARNIFNRELLSQEEKDVLETIKEKNMQVILPFPMFHIGSEMYQRNGEISIRPSMLYSYHSGLPLLSVMQSRTSLNESETLLEVLNRYKLHRDIEPVLAQKNILVLKSGSTLMKDEERVLKKAKPLRNTAENEFFAATLRDFVLEEEEKKKFISVPARSDLPKNIIFIPFQNNPGFIRARISDFTTVAKVDSNTIAGGDYTLSFHYHMGEKIFRFFHNNIIVIRKSNTQNENWDYFFSVRSATGFYGNFVVFEQKIKLNPHGSYEFLLNGPGKEYYRISHFLLKPDTMDLKMQLGKTTLYNNYPERVY